MKEFTKENLIKYLECLKNLETSLYCQKRALKKMYDMAEYLKKYTSIKDIPLKSIKLIEYEKPTVKDILVQMFIFTIIGIIISFVVAIIIVIFSHGFFSSIWDLLFFSNPFSGRIFPVVKWGALIGAICGFFIGKSDNKDEIKQQNEELIQNTNYENQQIKNTNAKNRHSAWCANNQLTVINKQISILQNSISKTQKHLNDFYSLNIIYPKYRGLVYICSIYEYFLSGRCSSLIGAYGAYNLLENDIKYAKVLEKLDIIVQKLDEIKQNQIELYNAITETNNQIESLNNSLKNITVSINRQSQSLNDLNYTMSNIEYNSRIAAQSAQYIALYNFFKN